MTVDYHAESPSHPEQIGAGHGEGSTTRRRILKIALTLMSQRGVDGTSMRDLAGAAGLNVASLYHYFPSKQRSARSGPGGTGFPAGPGPPARAQR